MTDIIRAEGRAGTDQPQIKYKDMGDGTHAMVVYDAASGGAGGATTDREVVVALYRVTQDGSGYVTGNVVSATRVLDVSGSTATQVGATTWYNESTAAAISAPNAGHITPMGQPGLTNAELRGSPVSITGTQLGSIQTAVENIPAQRAGATPVDTLGVPAVARQLAAGATSAETVLTTTCRRISIHALDAAIRYSIGVAAQTASATSHYIASGERLDLSIPSNARIAVIRAGSTSGTLEVTELS